MTHNTREGIGGWIEAPEVVRSKCRAICGENDIDCENEDVFIYRRIEIDTATDMAYQAGLSTLHQELQKARETWLREEIVKLEGMKYKTSYCGYSIRSTTVDTKSAVDCINGAEKMGRNQALQTIIDRYQSELDQPTRREPTEEEKEIIRNY